METVRSRQTDRKGETGRGEGALKEKKRNWERQLCNYQCVFRGQRNKLGEYGFANDKRIGGQCVYCAVK